MSLSSRGVASLLRPWPAKAAPWTTRRPHSTTSWDKVAQSTLAQDAEPVSKDEFAQAAAPTRGDDAFARHIVKDLENAEGATRNPLNPLTNNGAKPLVWKQGGKGPKKLTPEIDYRQRRLLVIRALPAFTDTVDLANAISQILPKRFPTEFTPFRMEKCKVFRAPNARFAAAFLQFYEPYGAEEVRKAMFSDAFKYNVSPLDASVHDVDELPTILHNFENMNRGKPKQNVGINMFRPWPAAPAAGNNGEASQITDSKDTMTADGAPQTKESPQAEASGTEQKAEANTN